MRCLLGVVGGSLRRYRLPSSYSRSSRSALIPPSDQKLAKRLGSVTLGIREVGASGKRATRPRGVAGDAVCRHRLKTPAGDELVANPGLTTVSRGGFYDVFSEALRRLGKLALERFAAHLAVGVDLEVHFLLEPHGFFPAWPSTRLNWAEMTPRGWCPRAVLNPGGAKPPTVSRP